MDTFPQKCSHGGFWLAIVLLVAGLAFSVLVNFGFLMVLVGSHLPSLSKAKDEYPELNEVWSYGRGDVKAVRIAVSGVISHESGGGFLGIEAMDPVESVLRQIQAARNDGDVRAIILEVASPGGDITATDEIYHALAAFRNSDKDRKVIVFVRDMAASGGLYVAMASDWIISEPTALIGSIGVIMQTLNWKELSEKVGVHDVTIKSGKNKDILNPFREVPPEQIGMLQGVTDEMYQQFFRIVQERRSMDPAQLKEVADGRVFVAAQALRYGLIDQLGYWEDVVSETTKRLGESSIRIVRYEEQPDFARLLSRIQLPLDLTQWMSRQGSPRFMYLWKP